MDKPKRAALQPPHLNVLDLSWLVEGDSDLISAHTSLEDQRFTGVDASGRDLAGMTFENCELLDWDAQGTELRGTRFMQSRLERLNAPVLSAPRTLWRDVEIADSRIGAVEWHDSELIRVEVANSKLGWVNLRASKLNDVEFRGCSFEELDLSGTSLTRVSFDDCTVGKLVLHGAKAQHFDLRGVEFRAIEGFDGLRGAVLSEFQVSLMAELFADHFGIIVKG